LDYAGLGPPQFIPADALRAVLRIARRGLILASTVAIALVISGGIFTFTPLVGLRIAHTSGISMEPAYKEGDVVLIKDVDESDLHVGDIVVFDALGQQFMHRIIEERTGTDGRLTIVTQGDNVARPDFPIQASHVNGKLVGEVPLLGTLSRLIDADGGFYVYRSVILTLAVTTVAVWGLAASARRRNERLAMSTVVVDSDAEVTEEPD
jgi:signal peptidase I